MKKPSLQKTHTLKLSTISGNYLTEEELRYDFLSKRGDYGLSDVSVQVSQTVWFKKST